MRVLTALIAAACLYTTAQAQDAGQANPPTGKPRVITRDVPKEPSVVDKFDLKTTDSGNKVQQRLELDVSKNKDIFIFGNKTTNYPTTRNPGQEYQPMIPQTPPKDTYSIGIGRRF